MFYRLKLKEGAALINLALVRSIKREGNRIVFWYQTNPTTFWFSSWQEIQYGTYTYETPDRAEEAFKDIEKRLTYATQLK